MPTIEELRSQELRETARHNRAQERLAPITSLIGSIGRIVPKGAYRLNDYSWYGSPDEDITDLFGKVDYSHVLGNSSYFMLASCYGLGWVPTLGNMEDDFSLPELNSMLTEAFKVLRSNNVSTSAFTKGDYALYHFGKIFIAITIMEAIKLLAITNIKNSNLNKGEPWGIAKVFNIDYDDLVANKPTYVNQLNALIKRFNAFVDLPETSILKRYNLLTSSIIIDHAKSLKGQFYVYYLMGTYTLNVTTSSLIPTKVNSMDRNSLQTKMKLSDYLSIIDNQLVQFETSTTIDNINGNISRAVGDKGYVISEIAHGGDDLRLNVVEHDEVLCQIQNSDFISAHDDSFFAASGSNRWTLKMNAASTSLYYENGRKLQLSHTDTSTLGGIYLVSERFSSDVDLLDGNEAQVVFDYGKFTRDSADLLSSYETKPSKEVTTVISRNKVVTKAISTVPHLVSCDTIALIERRISLYTSTGNVNGSTDTQPALIIDGCLGSVAVGQGTTSQVVYAALKLLENIYTQFDWAPWTLYYTLDTNYTNTAPTYFRNARCQEIDTFAIVTRDVYRQLNRAAVLNELGLKGIPNDKSAL